MNYVKIQYPPRNHLRLKITKFFFSFVVCHKRGFMQSLKCFTCLFCFRSLTVHSPCVQRSLFNQFTVHKPLTFTVHKAFTVRSLCAHRSFSVYSSFSGVFFHCHSELQFDGNNVKMKKGCMHIMVEGVSYLEFYRYWIYMRTTTFILTFFLTWLWNKYNARKTWNIPNKSFILHSPFAHYSLCTRICAPFALNAFVHRHKFTFRVLSLIKHRSLTVQTYSRSGINQTWILKYPKNLK